MSSGRPICGCEADAGGRPPHHPIADIAEADAVGLAGPRQPRAEKAAGKKVMKLKSGSLTILDPAKLACIGGFDNIYLHGRLKKFG